MVRLSARLLASLHSCVWFFFLYARISQAQSLGFNTLPVTWQATPFNGRSIPLVVKGPCNNVWAPQSSHTAPINQAWARSWDSVHDVKGWYASIRVDQIPYMLLGDASVPNITIANQTAVTISSTRTSYLLEAGPIIVNMTFLSPIEPSDPVKMSSPFSYLYFTFTSNDTSISHDVQLYSDITGEWISSNNQFNMTWDGSDDGSSTILHATLLTPMPFQTLGGTCQDGTIYYAMQSSNATSWQIDLANPLRTAFADGDALTNASNPNFRTIVDATFTTLAIAVDVGSVSETTEPVVYAIGLVRDPVIQYEDPGGQVQLLSPLYRGTYSDVTDLISAVFANFTDSVTAAEALDMKIASEGGSISSAYADLLAVSTRQAFGAADLTVGQTANSDISAFAWDIGDLGSGGVNAVDVIYAAMPAYIYLWPDLLGYLLDPLLEYQNGTLYPYAYAAQDLGQAYPNATGDSLPHNSQIEQSANMLIMSLAHAQASGDGSLLGQYYDLLVKWADFLVNSTLTPAAEETTSISDNISGANQTNLALKGIIGIGAMAKISKYGGRTANQSHYQNIAEQYMQQWTNLAVTSDFISLNYGSQESGVIYNLYVDKLLQTKLVDDSLYALQTTYYTSQIPQYQFGLPLSSANPALSRSDWAMFAAAVVTDTSVRDDLIGGLHAYVSSSDAGLGDWPFAVLYSPSNASELTDTINDNGGINSFSQGAMFAPLALSVIVKEPTFNGGSTMPPPHKRNAGAIAGGVVAGTVALAVVAFALCYCRRRRKWQIGDEDDPGSHVDPWTPTTITSTQSFPAIERASAPVIREKGGVRMRAAPLPDIPVMMPFQEKTRVPFGIGLERARRRGERPRIRTNSNAGTSSSLMSSQSSRSRTDLTSNYTNSETDDRSSLTVSTSPPRRTRVFDGGRRRSRRRNDSAGTEVLVGLREVEALRREVERIRIAQMREGSSGRESDLVPPPSYEDEVVGRARDNLRSTRSLFNHPEEPGSS